MGAPRKRQRPGNPRTAAPVQLLRSPVPRQLAGSPTPPRASPIPPRRPPTRVRPNAIRPSARTVSRRAAPLCRIVFCRICRICRICRKCRKCRIRAFCPFRGVTPSNRPKCALPLQVRPQVQTLLRQISPAPAPSESGGLIGVSSALPLPASPQPRFLLESPDPPRNTARPAGFVP